MRPFSSNYKELVSIKIAILRQLRVFRRYGTCLCHGRTLLHFTDNSVSANILRTGSSTSPDLAREARTILEATMEMNAVLITIHTSGKRMIAQGTDGLSRDARRGQIDADQWKLALAPVHSPKHLNRFKAILSIALKSDLDPAAPTSAPADLAGRPSIIFPTPWTAAAVAENACLALTIDPTTITVIVLPRRAPQLWLRSFRRFQLLLILEADSTLDPLWPLTEHEPLHIYLLDSFNPPPPLCDRYLIANAKSNRSLLGVCQADHRAQRLDALRELQHFLRSTQTLPDDQPLRVFVREALRLHLGPRSSDVQDRRGPHSSPPRLPSPPLGLRAVRPPLTRHPGQPPRPQPPEDARTLPNHQHLEEPSRQLHGLRRHGHEQDQLLRTPFPNPGPARAPTNLAQEQCLIKSQWLTAHYRLPKAETGTTSSAGSLKTISAALSFFETETETFTPQRVAGPRGQAHAAPLPTSASLLASQRFKKGLNSMAGETPTRATPMPTFAIHDLVTFATLTWDDATDQNDLRAAALLGSLTVLHFAGLYRPGELLLVTMIDLLWGRFTPLRALPLNLPPSQAIKIRPRTKTDTYSQGSTRYLSPTTASGINIQIWVDRLIWTHFLLRLPSTAPIYPNTPTTSYSSADLFNSIMRPALDTLRTSQPPCASTGFLQNADPATVTWRSFRHGGYQAMRRANADQTVRQYMMRWKPSNSDRRNTNNEVYDDLSPEDTVLASSLI